MVNGNISAQGQSIVKVKEGPTHLDQVQGPKIGGEGKEESSGPQTFFYKNPVKQPGLVIEANTGGGKKPGF